MCLDLSQTVIDLSRRALRRARPGATESDLRVEWVSLHYGVEIAKRFGARMEQLG